MKRLISILAAAFLSLNAVADTLVVASDTNGVLNVGSIRVGSVVATNEVDANAVDSGVYTYNEYADRLFDGDKFVYTATNNAVVNIRIPTNFPSDYTNYLHGAVTEDLFATTWYVDKRVGETLDAIKVIGSPEFYNEYTNNPPTNLVDVTYYVSNCVYLLSNVKPEVSYSEVADSLSNLTSRVISIEETAGKFGRGTDQLDYIIDSKIEDLDAEDLCNMLKQMA